MNLSEAYFFGFVVFLIWFTVQYDAILKPVMTKEACQKVPGWITQMIIALLIVCWPVLFIMFLYTVYVTIRDRL